MLEAEMFENKVIFVFVRIVYFQLCDYSKQFKAKLNYNAPAMKTLSIYQNV